MGIIRNTYEIVSPESATDGEAEESGWRDEEGAEFSVDDAISMLLGKAIEPSSSAFHSGVWYTDCDVETNFRTGTETREAYHLASGTWTVEEEEAIYNAVARLHVDTTASIVPRCRICAETHAFLYRTGDGWVHAECKAKSEA